MLLFRPSGDDLVARYPVLVSIAIGPCEHYNQPEVSVTVTQSSHPLVASLTLFYESLS